MPSRVTNDDTTDQSALWTLPKECAILFNALKHVFSEAQLCDILLPAIQSFFASGFGLRPY